MQNFGIPGRAPLGDGIVEAARGDLPRGMKVRNTFLQFEDEESWMVSGEGRPPRQYTDSILERSGAHLGNDWDQNIIATLQNHLGLGESSSSSAPGTVGGPRQFDFGAGASDAMEHRPLARLVTDEDNMLGYPSVAAGGEAKLSHPFLRGGHPFLSGAKPISPDADYLSMRPSDPNNLMQNLFRPEEHCDFEEEQAPVSLDTFDRTAAKVTESGGFADPFSRPDDLGEGDPEQGKVDPAVQAMREVAGAGGGLSGCTTVMIRHIPCKYSQRKLMREINSAGFLGRYDFFYLPMDPRSHANRGFAFLNFVVPDIAEDFYRMFHGSRLKHFNSDKVIAVMPADLQGFEQNAVHYAASRVLRRKRATNSKPLFFRPLPDNLTVDDSIEVLLDQPIYTPGPVSDSNRAGAAANDWQQQQQQQQPPFPSQLGNQGLRNAVAGHPGPGRAPDTTTPVRRTGPQSLEMNGFANGENESPAAGVQAPRSGQPIPKFCGFCGNPRIKDHMFCPYCGMKFQTDAQQ
jgi:hypothetical protein